MPFFLRQKKNMLGERKLFEFGVSWKGRSQWIKIVQRRESSNEQANERKKKKKKKDPPPSRVIHRHSPQPCLLRRRFMFRISCWSVRENFFDFHVFFLFFLRNFEIDPPPIPSLALPPKHHPSTYLIYLYINRSSPHQGFLYFQSTAAQEAQWERELCWVELEDALLMLFGSFSEGICYIHDWLIDSLR